jgi:tetratricopeptide (TPR) repeat protein
MSGADEDARRQLADAHAALTAMAGTSPADALSEAYGNMGRLFIAAELNDAAEPCFLNAIDLAPASPRWTYYLAHVYRRKHDLQKAARYFERTVTLRPSDVAALWWLGSMYLETGRPADAEARFTRALALQPGALSAVYGLGRAALARNDYAAAVGYFERVLAMNARATAAHYPLGLAYRGLGRLQEAETHLAQRTHVEIVPIDPLLAELDDLLHSVTAYQDRGMRAARSGDWDAAVALFRQAVELSPGDVSARLDLSLALAQTGDRAGAAEHAQEAVRLSPHDARARELVRVLSGPAGGILRGQTGVSDEHSRVQR